jgi:hypothetical protein
MSSTVRTLARVAAFARSVRPDVPAVDRALAALRQVLARAEVPYVIIGGVAVLHHGYARTTRDIDVLVRPTDAALLEPALRAAGFERIAGRRWRHGNDGAELDLVLAGAPIPPAARGTFPDPLAVPRSAREGDIADLPPLVALKLASRRHQDVADVVSLLKLLDEGEYLHLEGAVPGQVRALLAELRRDAVDERDGGG